MYGSRFSLQPIQFGMPALWGKQTRLLMGKPWRMEKKSAQLMMRLLRIQAHATSPREEVAAVRFGRGLPSLLAAAGESPHNEGGGAGGSLECKDPIFKI